MENFDSFIEHEGFGEGMDDLSSISINDMAAVSVDGTDWTVGTIINQVSKGNIILDPYFQRRDAWTKARKSQYIESLILGIPVPQIVLSELPGTRGKFIVIDGKQRLLSIMQFSSELGSGYNKLKLSGVPILKEIEGKSYEEISSDFEYSDYANAYENRSIRTNLIKNVKNEEILYQVFLRLNTGSVKLSPQELRRALSPSDFWVCLDDWALTSKGLSFIFKNKLPDFRMRDCELAIRFYAFRYLLESYTGNLKLFLDKASKRLVGQHNDGQSPAFGLGREFERASSVAIDIFEDNAFRKYRDKDYESRFNRAVFDVQMYYWADSVIAEKSLERRDMVRQSYQSLCLEDDKFIESIERTTKSIEATAYRFDAWARALSSVLGQEIVSPKVGAGN